MDDFVIVIPARYRSLRLPGKPLIDLEGKSMLLRTFEQCCKAVAAEYIYVATDDERIFTHCVENNMQVEMTASDCLTGTDRIADFAKKVRVKTYINVQGDEPLMNPEDLREIIKTSKNHPTDIINGYAAITSEEQYKSLHIPKVVFRPDKRLLYMSRSPIPGNKQGVFQKSWRQICIYAFPSDSLSKFAKQKQKTSLEQEEDIEILRFLELGFDVRMVELSTGSIAVDTPEDAIKVRGILQKMKIK